MILKFPGSPGTSATGSPSRSTSWHSSVAAGRGGAGRREGPAEERGAESLGRLGEPEGAPVERLARPGRPSPRFTVSVARRAASAAPRAAAASATARARVAVANGRAASCTRTTAHVAQGLEPGPDRVGACGAPGDRPGRDAQPRQLGRAAGLLAGRDHGHELVDHAARGEHARGPAEHGLAAQHLPLLGHAGAQARTARRQDAPHALAADQRASTGLALLVLLPHARCPSRPARHASRPPKRDRRAAQGPRGGRRAIDPNRHAAPDPHRQLLMLKIFRSSVSTSCSSQSFAMASSLMRSERAVSSILRSPKDRSLSARSR